MTRKMFAAECRSRMVDMAASLKAAILPGYSVDNRGGYIRITAPDTRYITVTLGAYGAAWEISGGETIPDRCRSGIAVPSAAMMRLGRGRSCCDYPAPPPAPLAEVWAA